MPDSERRGLRSLRRDLHAHPETGWIEFRTTAIVARELDRLGFDLHLGADAVTVEDRLGVPPDEELRAARERAERAGAPRRYLDELDTVTGLVATRTFGDGSGPTVGLRVDMDALEVTEADTAAHRPTAEGFASSHPGAMHACGHDGHTAIGVGVARELADETTFDGELRLFFQPAEEGGRGGLPMSTTPHLSDVEYFLAIHLGLGYETGTVVAGFERPLSNAKLDVTLHGESAHAGKAPEEGDNALQAATTAIQNLYGIARHSDGATRVNVGYLNSPNPQNVIADTVEFRIEVRGETSEVSEYMRSRAKQIVRHAGAMHDVDCAFELYGKTTTFTADREPVDVVSEAASTVPAVGEVLGRTQLPASEDAAYLISRVQEEGGLASYVGIGSTIPSGHHTSRFDIDESSLDIATTVLTNAVERFGRE
jgi:aminobenzoyl-glutamate utilization protein A